MFKRFPLSPLSRQIMNRTMSSSTVDTALERQVQSLLFYLPDNIATYTLNAGANFVIRSYVLPRDFAK